MNRIWYARVYNNHHRRTHTYTHSTINSSLSINSCCDCVISQVSFNKGTHTQTAHFDENYSNFREKKKERRRNSTELEYSVIKYSGISNRTPENSMISRRFFFSFHDSYNWAESPKNVVSNISKTLQKLYPKKMHIIIAHTQRNAHRIPNNKSNLIFPRICPFARFTQKKKEKKEEEIPPRYSIKKIIIYRRCISQYSQWSFRLTKNQTNFAKTLFEQWKISILSCKRKEKIHKKWQQHFAKCLFYWNEHCCYCCCCAISVALVSFLLLLRLRLLLLYRRCQNRASET